MPKRIALFVLGMVLAVGAFLLYQYFGGPDLTGGKRPKSIIKEAPATLPMTFERRTLDGRLLYVVTAANSPAPILDENHNPIPGQFTLEKPVATIYDVTGRTIKISADTCKANIDQGAKGAVGLGATTKGSPADRMNLRLGELSGHVRMVISPRPVAASAPATTPTVGTASATATAAATKESRDPFPKGLVAYFDETLTFDGVQQTLTTPGGIHIRSSTADFDGQGMQLVVNRDDKTKPPIEFLRIDHGTTAILRGAGTKMLDITEGTPVATTQGAGPARPPTTARNPAVAGAATKPGQLPPTTYRLTFAQDVVATAREQRVSGEQLNVLFMPGTGDSALLTAAGGAENPVGTAPAAGGADAGAAGLPNADMIPEVEVPETPGPIPPAGVSDVSVTWAGPMELRPSDEKLESVNDKRVEIIGTAAKPVEISDTGRKFAAQSGHLLYHDSEKAIHLEPGDFKKVVLNDDVRGNVECGDVTIRLDPDNPHAILMGPGALVAHAESKINTITWKTHMDLDMQYVPDPGSPDPTVPDPSDPRHFKKTLVIRHAVVYGPNIVQTDLETTTKLRYRTFDMVADVLDVAFANVVHKDEKTKDGKAKPDRLVAVPEHFLATGNVVTNHFNYDMTDQGGIKARQLEVLYAKSDGSPDPVPSQLLADGEVSAWRLSSKSLAAAPGVTQTKPAGTAPANDQAPKITKSVITAPKLVAELTPKPSAAAVPATATAPATEPANDSLLTADMDVTRFLATGGVNIEITPPDAPKIVASAESIDAQPDKRIATLVATSAAKPVRVASGENKFEGPRIEIDNSIKVPGTTSDLTYKVKVEGAGSFVFAPAKDDKKVEVKDAKKEVKPDMYITWQDSMEYDDSKMLAVFMGKTTARTLDAATVDQAKSDQALLVAEKKLTVKTKVPTTQPATSTAPAATTPAVSPGHNNPLSGNRELDWILAEGNVEAYGAQLMGDSVQQRVRISVLDIPANAATGVPAREGQLRYNDTTKSFDVPGPGSLVVEDHRPKKADEKRTPGQYVFGWTGGMHFDSDASTATLSKDVNLFFQPDGRLPFTKNLSAGASSPATTRADEKDIVLLATNQLVATFAKLPVPTTKPAATNPGSSRPATKPATAVPGDSSLIKFNVGELQTVTASEGATIDVNSYHLVGANRQNDAGYHIAGNAMNYDVQHNTVLITSKEGDRVVASRIGFGSFSGTSIKMDLTKEKNYLEVPSFEGDFGALTTP